MARAGQRGRGECGATAVEYALIVVFIAAVVVGAVTNLGTLTEQLFDSIVGRF